MPRGYLGVLDYPQAKEAGQLHRPGGPNGKVNFDDLLIFIKGACAYGNPGIFQICQTPAATDGNAHF